jgi:hypothetical protein
MKVYGILSESSGVKHLSKEEVMDYEIIVPD